MEKKETKNKVVKNDQKKANNKKIILPIIVLFLLLIAAVVTEVVIEVNKEKEDKYLYSTKIYCYGDNEDKVCRNNKLLEDGDKEVLDTLKEYTIKCKTECKLISDGDIEVGNRGYVAIREKNSSFIYNIKNNKRVIDGLNVLYVRPLYTYSEKNDIALHGMILYSGDPSSEKTKIGYFNFSNEKLVLPIEYDGIEFPAEIGSTSINSEKPYVVVKKDEKYAIINILTGKTVLDYTKDAISIKFLEDFYIAKYFVKTIDKKEYLIDEKGNLFLGKKGYSKIYKLFKDSNKLYTLVNTGDKINLIDIDGKIITTLQDWKSSYVYGISDYTEYEKSYKVFITYQDENNLCNESYYDFKTKKVVSIKYKEECGGYAKPVLYLYPTKETKINVTFEKEDLLTTTYPKYKNSWNVIAKPNGDLYDENGKYYYALYWEEQKNHSVDFSEGFYVTSENAISFLEEKLDIIGFNDKEKNEFIMYWLPIIEKNKKNLIYFELTKERDSYNKLNISPKPDSLLRVAIHVKKVNKKTNIKEEKLPTFDRKGYTAIEWGGVKY